MGLHWRISDRLQLRADSIFHAHCENLYIRVPKLRRRVFESIRGLSIGDQNHNTRYIRTSASGLNKNPLSHIRHGFAGVRGATAVGKRSHGFDHSAQIVVSVQVELSVWVSAVLDQADLNFFSPNVKCVDQDFQESSNFSEVCKTDTVGTVDQENDVGLYVHTKRTF